MSIAFTVEAPWEVSVTSGTFVYPGCVLPSMVTGTVTGGRLLLSVMVCAPPPPALKAMVEVLPLAFASRMAWRSEPGPLSAFVVTV
ncbi:MAG TPA: hypothetical protein VEK11_08610 [Thermoanaerobaculia bacterium]|nr:hypothetical protein [Thermoanaerobaculia bacterium]